MGTDNIIILALLLIFLREVVIILLAWRKIVTLEEKQRIECTTRRFAKARAHLMDLAVQGIISTDSYTFQSLYTINTFVMRRPDQYAEISALLFRVILTGENSKDPDPLTQESVTWTPEIKAVMRETAEAIGIIILDHSFLLKWVLRLEGQFKTISALVGFLAYMRGQVQRSLANQDPVMDSLLRAQQEMFQIAATA